MKFKNALSEVNKIQLLMSIPCLHKTKNIKIQKNSSYIILYTSLNELKQSIAITNILK